MKMLFDIQKKIIPDLLHVLSQRYRILRFIRLMQPIGRRSLSSNLGLSERVLRSEVTFLKDQGLIDMATSGMTLTDVGKQVLADLDTIMNDVLDINKAEQQLRQSLNLSEVIIIPGNSDEDSWVKKEMGRATIQVMKRNLADQKSKIVALTGGSTVASVAEMMTPDAEMKAALFVPARGGLGEKVENQANTICATMATKAMGNYRLLHVPDQLSEDSYKSLMEEPNIKEILDLIKSSNIVVHGIGEATAMAERRSSSCDVMNLLKENEAVAEAFGYYFNKSGEIIHRVLTIGLQLDDVANLKTVIAVAGGKSKAEAIVAFMKQGTSTVLITDEGAANAILQLH